MAKKEFMYKGKKLDEIKQMTAKEFAELATSRVKKSLNKGLKDSHKRFFKKLNRNRDKAVKTHCRDIIIVPEMIGKTILVHNGKEYKAVNVSAEMIGHYLGEFSLSRSKVAHSSPGVGATKSSAHVSVK